MRWKRYNLCTKDKEPCFSVGFKVLQNFGKQKFKFGYLCMNCKKDGNWNDYSWLKFRNFQSSYFSCWLVGERHRRHLDTLLLGVLHTLLLVAGVPFWIPKPWCVSCGYACVSFLLGPSWTMAFKIINVIKSSSSQSMRYLWLRKFFYTNNGVQNTNLINSSSSVWTVHSLRKTSAERRSKFLDKRSFQILCIILTCFILPTCIFQIWILSD